VSWKSDTDDQLKLGIVRICEEFFDEVKKWTAVWSVSMVVWVIDVLLRRKPACGELPPLVQFHHFARSIASMIPRVGL
jgi:hypothetical protein